MHRNGNLLSVFKRIFFDEHINLVPVSTHAIETIRGYAGGTATITPFKQMLADRQDEARRSILVQVQSEQSCEDLMAYCNDFGTVRSLHHCQTLKNAHFVLVEMIDDVALKEVLHNSSHLGTSQAIPVLSPFLWFKISSKKRQKKINSHCNITRCGILASPSKDLILGQLKEERSVSNQLETLLRTTQLDELGIRLRFLTAHQIDTTVSGLFRKAMALPFGSSVNGFGKNGCDLDLVLIFPEEDNSKASRLMHHAKACSADDRLQVQNHIEVLGDLMHCFMPGCVSVKKITQARVPIIKYRQELTNLDCDLSLYNTTCLQMSEILYLFGLLDVRVREIVFAVRAWAKEIGLTNPSPGRWISNFSLTLLVIFFLQQSPIRILPPFGRLRQKTTIMTNEEFNTYASNLISQSTENTISSEELFLKFFQYYATFDFSSFGINLLSGKPVVKPDYTAMFIVNPIEPELNVSKNVSIEETGRLMAEMKNAAWLLETSREKPMSGELWGLAKLLEGNAQSQAIAQHFSRSRTRLVDVKSLFDG